MPAWPGGPCPECGDDMPENIIHCRSCRALLNNDLEQDSVEIPAFIPLPEIDSYVDVKPEGYYIACPHCNRELKINGRFLGANCTCKSCNGAFALDLAQSGLQLLGYYGTCPHCAQRVRMAKKYAGIKVACKFCTGRIKLVE